MTVKNKNIFVVQESVKTNNWQVGVATSIGGNNGNPFQSKYPWIIKEIQGSQIGDINQSNLSVENSIYWKGFFVFILSFVLLYLLWFGFHSLFF
jgi:hypothetical protein